MHCELMLRDDRGLASVTGHARGLPVSLPGSRGSSPVRDFPTSEGGPGRPDPFQKRTLSGRRVADQKRPQARSLEYAATTLSKWRDDSKNTKVCSAGMKNKASGRVGSHLPKAAFQGPEDADTVDLSQIRHSSTDLSPLPNSTSSFLGGSPTLA